MTTAEGVWRYRLLKPVFLLPFYEQLLRGVRATRLERPPGDVWPGNAERGRAIVKDSFTFAGQTITQPAPLWAPAGARPAWREAMHSFEWLRDLRAAGGDEPRRKARELVSAWLEDNSRWEGEAWHPVIIGRRLAAWLGSYEFYAASADAAFQARVIDSMARQARHLAFVLPAGLAGSELIGAIKGLILAAAGLPGGRRFVDTPVLGLGRELSRQILADGGHVERSPAVQAGVLRDLLDIRAALSGAAMEVPADLPLAIERMAPMLRLLRHGDGGLSLFNGAGEDEGWRLDLILQRVEGRTKPFMYAPQSGFQRLQAGRTLVIADSGQPPAPGYDKRAHAGTLSFEMSAGRERLIVNCGAYPEHPEWGEALRATAAHSTLSIGGEDSSRLKPGGGLSQRPDTVSCRREEGEGHVWLDLSHDGYKDRFGLIHHRRLYLAANGEDLRGEDRVERLSGEGEGEKPEIVLRFHLHPEVQASLAQGGTTALLRLPSRTGWRFRVGGGATMSLEPSVYCGQAPDIRRSEQLVIRHPVEGRDTVIKWAVQREGKQGRKRK